MENSKIVACCVEHARWTLLATKIASAVYGTFTTQTFASDLDGKIPSHVMPHLFFFARARARALSLSLLTGKLRVVIRFIRTK